MSEDWISLLAEDCESNPYDHKSFLHMKDFSSTTTSDQYDFKFEYKTPVIDIWLPTEGQSTNSESDVIEPPPVFPQAKLSTLSWSLPILLLQSVQSFTNRLAHGTSKTIQFSYQASSLQCQHAIKNLHSYLIHDRVMRTKVYHGLMVSSEVVQETVHFGSDRVSSFASDYIQGPLFADDPEIQHTRKLARSTAWDTLPLRCALASLTWKQLRLVAATKLDNEQSETPIRLTTTLALWSFLAGLGEQIRQSVYHGLSSSESSGSKGSVQWRFDGSSLTGDEIYNDTDYNDDDDGDREEWVDPSSSNPVDDIANLVPSQRFDQWWLADKAQMGDIEAQFALSRFFCPPEFHKLLHCESCQQYFSPCRFRHHCRACGSSVCKKCSPSRRTIVHLGFDKPVRCCRYCSDELDREAHFNQLHWRELRVRAFLGNALLPYSPASVDTKVDKIMRVLDGTLIVAKKTIVFNYPAYLLLEAVDIVRRYGMSGLAGVLLRKDFLYAVETLKRISGLDKMFKLSLHELTACIYYKLAIDRGIRGCDPNGEHILHEEQSQEQERIYYGSIGEEAQSSGNTRSALLKDLDEAIKYAPLALQAVYEQSEIECQRLAFSQGWCTILCCVDSAPEQPAYALFANQDRANINSKRTNEIRPEIVLAIRGTSSVQDVVTDIRSAPHKFPPSSQEIDDAISGLYRSRDTSNCYGTAQQVEVDASSSEGAEYVPVTLSQWEWTQDMQDQRYACRGMAVSALWLLSQVGPSLFLLASQGYDVVITGHSLGAGVASLLVDMLRNKLSNVRAVVYGSPSCVDRETAKLLERHVLSVVLRDDFISRVTPQSIRLLMSELLVFRAQVFRHLEQDWRDVIARLGSLWSPRWRDSKQTGRTVTDTSTVIDGLYNVKSTPSEQSDEGEIIPEEKIPDLWLPGRLMHLYSYRGQYRVSAVGADFPSLRRIEVQGNMFNDHMSSEIFDALLEVIFFILLYLYIYNSTIYLYIVLYLYIFIYIYLYLYLYRIAIFV